MTICLAHAGFKSRNFPCSKYLVILSLERQAHIQYPYYAHQSQCIPATSIYCFHLCFITGQDDLDTLSERSTFSPLLPSQNCLWLSSLFPSSQEPTAKTRIFFRKHDNHNQAAEESCADYPRWCSWRWERDADREVNKQIPSIGIHQFRGSSARECPEQDTVGYVFNPAQCVSGYFVLVTANDG